MSLLRPLRLVLVFLGAFLALTAPSLSADAPGTSPADALYARGKSLYDDHRFPEAIPLFQEVLAADPRHLDATVHLGLSLTRVNRRVEAIKLLSAALEHTPDDHALLGAYGAACLFEAAEAGTGFRAFGLARRGRDALERASALAPEHLGYREGLVDFYRRAPALAGGSRAKARAHAEAITRIDEVRGRLLQAAILIDDGKHAEALRLCENALAVRPDDYLALYSFGRTAADGGIRLAEGERALRRCLEKTPAFGEPNHAGVHYRLGMIQQKRGDLDAARESYRAALRETPGYRAPARALEALD